MSLAATPAREDIVNALQIVQSWDAFPGDFAKDFAAVARLLRAALGKLSEAK